MVAPILERLPPTHTRDGELAHTLGPALFMNGLEHGRNAETLARSGHTAD